jgi:hypothetical protein
MKGVSSHRQVVLISYGPDLASDYYQVGSYEAIGLLSDSLFVNFSRAQRATPRM